MAVVAFAFGSACLSVVWRKLMPQPWCRWSVQTIHSDIDHNPFLCVDLFLSFTDDWATCRDNCRGKNISVPGCYACFMSLLFCIVIQFKVYWLDFCVLNSSFTVRLICFKLYRWFSIIAESDDCKERDFCTILQELFPFLVLHDI